MPYSVKVTESDRAQADSALEFLRDHFAAMDQEQMTDYIYNLSVAVRQSSVTSRLAGIVASALPYYLREIGKLEEQKLRAATPSTHMGSVGDRIDFSATLVSVFPHESDFGTTFITKMVTDAGQVLTWFASNDCTTENAQEAAERGLLCRGVMSKVTGKVKKHDLYKGEKQTLVTRCTVWTAEGIKQANEKAAKKAARDAKKAAKSATV